MQDADTAAAANREATAPSLGAHRWDARMTARTKVAAPETPYVSRPIPCANTAGTKGGAGIAPILIGAQTNQRRNLLGLLV